jgi:hypothetical protein
LKKIGETVKKLMRHFPFLSTDGGTKMQSSYDETIFAASHPATAAIATLVQGFDAVPAL